MGESTGVKSAAHSRGAGVRKRRVSGTTAGLGFVYLDGGGPVVRQETTEEEPA